RHLQLHLEAEPARPMRRFQGILPGAVPHPPKVGRQDRPPVPLILWHWRRRWGRQHPDGRRSCEPAHAARSRSPARL
ncbi:hypothetical protein EV182_003350, partial [Spiromyces aspiralis]